jgi:hypothetical protein
MTQEDPEDLPNDCLEDVTEGMAHVPGRAAQLALRDKVYDMLEVFTTRSGSPGTRLSNAWLGDHDWRVQLLKHRHIRNSGPVTMFEPLVAALRRRGIPSLCGTSVEAQGLAFPTAVWRVPLDERYISSFFGAHRFGFNILFPEDRSFAIHATEDVYAAFAAPEALLREVLLPEFQGEAALADLKDYMDHDFGEDAFANMLPHYAPFLLEG